MVDTFSQAPLRAGVLEDWQHAWSHQDIDGICALCADDLHFEDVPMGLRADSLEELRTAVLGPTFAMIPDFGMEILEAHEGADFAVTKWKISGTMTGPMTVGTASVELKNFSYESIVTSIIQFNAEGKIRAFSDNWDCSVFYRS